MSRVMTDEKSYDDIYSRSRIFSDTRWGADSEVLMSLIVTRSIKLLDLIYL